MPFLAGDFAFRWRFGTFGWRLLLWCWRFRFFLCRRLLFAGVFFFAAALGVLARLAGVFFFGAGDFDFFFVVAFFAGDLLGGGVLDFNFLFRVDTIV